MLFWISALAEVAYISLYDEPWLTADPYLDEPEDLVSELHPDTVVEQLLEFFEEADLESTAVSDSHVVPRREQPPCPSILATIGCTDATPRRLHVYPVTVCLFEALQTVC